MLRHCVKFDEVKFAIMKLGVHLNKNPNVGVQLEMVRRREGLRVLTKAMHVQLVYLVSPD